MSKEEKNIAEEEKVESVNEETQSAEEENPAKKSGHSEDKKEAKETTAKNEEVEEVKASEDVENKEKTAEEKKVEEAEVEKTEKAEELKAENLVKEGKEEEPNAEKAAKEDQSEEVKAEKPEKGNQTEEVKAEKTKEDFNQDSREDFDWDAFETKGFGEGYSTKKKEEMASMYEGTLTTIEENEVVEGTVVGVNARDVILNIGFKSDGLVSASEFREFPDLKVGDRVEVFIEEQENANGQLVLSRRKAKIVQAWDNITKAYENDGIIEGFVKRRTKGGLIVDIYGVEAFLPGSQIDVKPIRDFDVFVDKAMEVKVVKINYTNDNVVVSHKVLIEKDLEKQKAEILNNLEKGQVLEGTIKNMTNFGVFIDLGGVDGLLHITDISWGRINHPEEVLNLDETVKVVVLDFDEDKKRISLGMKQLTEHPWDSLPKDLDIGSKVKGKIVNVADYGAFLEIQPGVEGLIHVSEMSWSQHLRNPQDFINIGDELEAVVLTLDREDRKMSLGIKQLAEDPWTKQDVLTKYAVGTTHKGIVRNLTNFGLFIELEEGIDGLVHVSDLSWTKKIKHPSEFIKVGDELEVQVLELDVDNRRLALSHKHLEENPWDTFETVFTPGSVHKCTIISQNEKGATLELPYGVEGFCSSKNLLKEDDTKPEVGETLDFKVQEFSKDDKRIVLSHKGVYSQSEEKPKPAPKKRSKSGGTSNKVNKDSEKSTLGDLEALSALKDKMEGKSAREAEGKERPVKKSATKKVEEELPEGKTSTTKAEEAKAKIDEVKAEKAESDEPNAEKTKDSEKPKSKEGDSEEDDSKEDKK